ncbi:hypothetical protein BDY24DRAFT_395140 [Mrakia frigida]|uniref:uncharacterized protein n=1 Tax=Mrakia frigida TaxID=29902 RepID=UPI003FCC07CB
MVGRLVVADGKSWRPRSVLVGMRLLLVLRKDLGRRTLTVEMSLGMHGDLLMLEMELLLLDLLLLELLLLNLLLLLDLLLLLLLLLLEVVMMVMNSDGSRSHHPWRRLVEGTESLRLSQATESEQLQILLSSSLFQPHQPRSRTPRLPLLSQSHPFLRFRQVRPWKEIVHVRFSVSSISASTRRSARVRDGDGSFGTTTFDGSLLPVDPPPLPHHVRHHVPLQLLPSVPPPLPNSTDVCDSNVLVLGLGLSDPFRGDVELAFSKGAQTGLKMLKDGMRTIKQGFLLPQTLLHPLDV